MNPGNTLFEIDQEILTELGGENVPPELLQEIEAAVTEYLNGAATAEVAPEGVVEHKHPLGTHNLPNQTRLHKHGPFNFKFETRSQKVKVWVVFRHPNLQTFVNHAVSCVAAAAVGSAVFAAATNNPAAGLALFKPGWKACMLSKVGATIANQIQVELKTEIITGNWSGH